MAKRPLRKCALASMVVLAGLAGCHAGGGGGGGPTPPASPSPTPPGFPSTANSIVYTSGAGRSDPEGVAPASPATSHVTWKDSRGADRTAVLWGYLYQYDFSFVGGETNPSLVTTRSANDDAYGHPGFGYVVSHNTQTGNSPIGKGNAPSLVKTTVFTGGHHAIHHVELVYDRDQEGGGNGIKIPVVIEWLVATGRDHPVWAVTWKTGAIVNPQAVDFDQYRMDTRAPYGSLNFDGAATKADGDAIGGVAWGDFALKFQTTDAQLTLGSPWTYTTPGDVAFTRAWTATVNAEMGIVETRPGDKQMGYPDRVVGRERGVTSADAYPLKGDCTAFSDARAYTVPCIAGWPYQLMNFDWDPTSGKPANEATGTKLIAWGTPFGFLGATNADLFDYSATYDARGDRSYATFIVLGPKCRYDGMGSCNQDGDVALTIAQVDALASATITNVTAGAVVAQVPAGPGATGTKTIANGYDDSYAVFTLSAASNHVAFDFTPGAAKPVVNPIFRVQGWTSPTVPTITVDAAPISVNDGTAASGAFASLDTVNHELWVTLNRTVGAAATIDVH